MITIKDIAKEAKVSEGTVDRVLHDRGGVSKKTEKKIKKILDKHNFSVNPFASALAMKSKHKIATLIPNYNDSDLFWRSPYLGILKASEEIKKFGIEVDNFKFNQYDALEYVSAFNDLIESNPSGVIIVPNFFQETKEMVSQLEALDIPYMFLNIDIDKFDSMAFIGQDSYTAGYVAGKLMHLSLFKKSSILIIQSRHNITENNTVSERIKGFSTYFSENKINVKTLTLKIDNLNKKAETTEKINSYLKQHNNIEGIFVPSSRIYLITNSIEDNRLKKLKLIGFDNTPPNIECLLDESVSFLISQKPFDQGYESVRLMSECLVNKKKSHTKMYLPIDILTKENVIYNDRKQFTFESENTNFN